MTSDSIVMPIYCPQVVLSTVQFICTASWGTAMRTGREAASSPLRDNRTIRGDNRDNISDKYAIKTDIIY